MIPVDRGGYLCAPGLGNSVCPQVLRRTPVKQGGDRAFDEPFESQTDEAVVEVASSQFLEVARQMTAQTASLIQEQPDLASEAQARVFAGTAVKLLY
jgi:hypothetical protein